MTFEELLRQIVREEMRAALAEQVAKAPVAEEPRADLTVEEAASEARLSVPTIRQRIREGKLAAHRPPGCREYRIDRAAFESWLRGERPTPPVIPPPREVDVDEEVERIMRLDAERRRRQAMVAPTAAPEDPGDQGPPRARRRPQ